jgi:hypothetical protein
VALGAAGLSMSMLNTIAGRLMQQMELALALAG